MSNLIEELSTIPEWNTLGFCLKSEFSNMSSDELDNLNEDEVEHLLWKNYKSECTELVARLVMIKIREEWRKENKDEFDRFISVVTKDWSEEEKARYLKRGA